MSCLKKQMKRRDVLGNGIASVSALALMNTPVLSKTIYRVKAPFPDLKGDRVVIVGGGIAALTVARYLKKNAPEKEVVLIDPRSVFRSNSLDNLWLAGLVQSDFLHYSYLTAARRGDYTFVQASVHDMSLRQKKVFTSLGYIDYTHLVLALDQQTDYARLGLRDKSTILKTAQSFPGLNQGTSAALSHKVKLEYFEGGNFVINVPPGAYRNPALPYEMACIAGQYMASEGIEGRVFLLDNNPKPKIFADQFSQTFKKLSQTLEYVPNSKIQSIDPVKKTLETSKGKIEFEDAILSPSTQPKSLFKLAKLTEKTDKGLKIPANPFTYESTKAENVYIIGDTRPQPFTKCESTDYSEGRYVAQLIAGKSQNQPIEWRSPYALTFALSNPAEKKSVKLRTQYKFENEHNGHDNLNWFQTNKRVSEEASTENVKEALNWYKQLIKNVML